MVHTAHTNIYTIRAHGKRICGQLCGFAIANPCLSPPGFGHITGGYVATLTLRLNLFLRSGLRISLAVKRIHRQNEWGIGQNIIKMKKSNIIKTRCHHEVD